MKLFKTEKYQKRVWARAHEICRFIHNIRFTIVDYSNIHSKVIIKYNNMCNTITIFIGGHSYRIFEHRYLDRKSVRYIHDYTSRWIKKSFNVHSKELQDSVWNTAMKMVVGARDVDAQEHIKFCKGIGSDTYSIYLPELNVKQNRVVCKRISKRLDEKKNELSELAVKIKQCNLGLV